jgi:hypothetical protein
MLPSALITASLRQKALELIDRAGPEGLMTDDPTLCIAQGLPTQLEPMNAALDPSLDKASLFEHLQMLRDRGLGGAEPPAKLACAPSLAPGERMNHRSTRAVRQSAKG